MRIARLQVEEGFLDGLDLLFQAGLNVIIGERGTGKTSVIELIRYALGIENLVPSAAEASRNHALAILGTGRVTLTLSPTERSEQELVYVRSASDGPVQHSGVSGLPLILSQTEIENLGLQPAGRLKLIDGIEREQSIADDEQIYLSKIRSLTKEIASQRFDLEQQEAELHRVNALQKQLSELEIEEKKVGSASKDVAILTQQLETLTKQVSSIAVAHDDLARISGRLRGRVEVLQSVIASWADDDSSVSRSPLVRSLLARSALALETLRKAVSDAQSTVVEVEKQQGHLERTRRGLEQQARKIRQEIERLSQGAGLVAARSHDLRRELAMAEARGDVVDELARRISVLRFRRSAILDELDSSRERSFERRNRIANRLNKRLHPRIAIRLERSGYTEPYAAVISNALKGSGLRHNELSRDLAKSVSPRELAEWAESLDVDSFSSASRLSHERAVKCLLAIRQSDLANILTLKVDDDAELYLFDKSTHKNVTDLSTGQRCTVILPILLEREGGALIMDQPEDHIDNAFIVETLIKAISDHSRKDQIIVSTHNANIPVLGEADLVIQMASDGRRGFVEIAAPLSDSKAVLAITRIMEGGRRAFETRATFYNEAR